MRPNRAGVSERTETIAAPGLMLRYSSAISSAGVLERTTLATSLSARRRSACCASSIPSNKTVGLDIVLRLSANEPYLAGRSPVREGRPKRRPLSSRLLHCTAAGVDVPTAVAPKQKQLHVVRRHRLGQVRRHHHRELGLVPLVAHRAEQHAQNRNVAQERDLADRRLNLVGEEAGDGEALTVGQPDGGLALPRGE